MPVSSVSFGSQESHTQRAIPRLLYRSSSSPTDSITHGTSEFKNSLLIDNPITAVVISVPDSPTNSQYSIKSTSFESSPHSTTRLPSYSSIPPTSKARSPSSSSCFREIPKQSKSKKSSFLSFFSVKEPSTQAWIDYQETVRKKQTGKSKRVKAVGMCMVSSAQLPSTVPKVNSKWDGIPEAIKEKEKSSRRHLNAVRSSANSTSTDLSLKESSTRGSSSSIGFWRPPGSAVLTAPNLFDAGNLTGT